MEEPLGEQGVLPTDGGRVGRDPVDRKKKILKNVQKKDRKTKRGGKDKNKSKSEGKFVIYGTNSAGLASKLESLKNVCKTVQPKVFMIQETKLSKHKELKIDQFEIFERKRNDKGGGLAIGFHESLEPYEICDDEKPDSVEILVVESKVQNKSIRFITAYGPQEPHSEEERKNNSLFFNKL